MLCGGRSQRMGRPKALLPWFGRSLIEHVVGLLAPCVDEVLVVTSSALALPASLDARIVVDREHERGPLAAMRDGLAEARSEVAFVTSTDAPFLTPAHVAAVFAAAEASGGRGAAAPDADGFLQVLSAVFPCSAWREAEVLLAAGVASPAALLERLGFASVPVEVREGVAPWTGFNTPEDYLALARLRDPRATAEIEWRRPSPSTRAGAARPADVANVADWADEVSHREVPIGRLLEVLRAAAPDRESALGDLFVERLRISLGGEVLAPPFEPGMPVGPGERVVVREAPVGPARLRTWGR